MTLRLRKKVLAVRKPSKWEPATLSGPIVGPDGVYVGEEFEVNELVKFDRVALEALWRVKTERYGPLDVLGGDLMAGSFRSRVGRFDGRTGELLWEVPAPNCGFDFWRERVLIRGEGMFDVVNPSTGAIVERIPMPLPDLVSFGFIGDRVLVREERGERPDPTICFDLLERKVVWEAPLIAQIRERYGIDDDNAIITFVPGSSPERLIAKRGWGTFACSIEDGRLLWGVPLALGYGPPDVREGRVHGLMTDRFIALDEVTGEVVYDVQHAELTGSRYPATGVFFRGQVAYAMQSGHLAVFNLKDGSLTGFHKYREALWRVAEADGRLLVTAGDGNLLVFEGL